MSTEGNSMDSRIALITGGSQGLGLAMAGWLLRQGWRVILVARSPEKLKAARDSLQAATGRVLIFAADISKSADMQALQDFVRVQCGSIDFLINNAGVFSTDCLEDMSIAAIERDVATSLTGTLFCTRALIPLLKPGAPWA